MDIRTAKKEYEAAIECCFEAGRMSWDELTHDEKLELWGWKVRATQDLVHRHELLVEHNDTTDIASLLATVALNDHRHATFDDWKDHRRTDLEDLAKGLLKGALEASKKQISEDMELQKWEWYESIREDAEIEACERKHEIRKAA